MTTWAIEYVLEAYEVPTRCLALVEAANQDRAEAHFGIAVLGGDETVWDRELSSRVERCDSTYYASTDDGDEICYLSRGRVGEAEPGMERGYSHVVRLEDL